MYTHCYHNACIIEGNVRKVIYLFTKPLDYDYQQVWGLMPTFSWYRSPTVFIFLSIFYHILIFLFIYYIDLNEGKYQSLTH